MKKTRKPAPIKTKAGVMLEIIGFGDKEALPYIRLECLERGEYLGVIADRDLKRLKKWVETCLNGLR